MNWKQLLFAALVLPGCVATEVVAENTAENTPAEKPAPVPTVTERGKIVIELYPAKAPKTCEQILGLVDRRFYENQRVHRVEDWVIQWGDPQSKEANWSQNPAVGSQGSGKQLPFEANDLKMAPGTVAMASTGEKVGGDSQLFILTSRCQPEQLGFLQDKYCAFGKVVEGMAVVDSLARGDLLLMKRSGAKPTDKKAPVRVEITVKTGA